MTRIRALVCVLALAGASVASAQPPAPINSTLHSFPGSMPGPFSARSAALALADRWLGDEPAGNPAAAPRLALTLSPALLRANRQDLAARNRHFDQKAAFIDAAGASAGYRVGAIGLHAYAYQPVARLEDVVFERGLVNSPTPPGVLQSEVTAREIRAGLGVSWVVGGARVGAAGEWTKRDDTYHTVETSGAPEAGESRVAFSGEAFGFQAGARMDRGEGAGAYSVGVAARFVPALTLEGEQQLDLRLGSSTATVAAERESGWEGGVSGRYAVSRSFRVLAGVGGRTAQTWSGFDVTSGKGLGWSAAFDYEVPESAWVIRFGLGMEQQSGVPEPRAGVIGLGFSWTDGDTQIEVGALRRNLDRGDLPTAFDDRVVGSLTITF